MTVLLAKVAAVDYGAFAERLALDVVTIAVLTHLLFLQRHGRRDLRDTFVIVNVCVFAVLSVIGSQKVSIGVAFGLFAILSIIRLRSEPYDNIEIAYFFGSLTLGLVNGFENSPLTLVAVLDAVILATVYVIDHRTLRTRTVRRRKVTLDSVETDSEALRTKLSKRIGVEIVGVTITEVDYVHKTTSVVISYVADSKAPPDASSIEDD